MTKINGLPVDAQSVDPKIDPARVGGKKQLHKDDFLKIFLTNLLSQNPLKPMENSEMLQQMAQMTSISATEELQKTIEGLNVNLAQSQILGATQLVNRRVQLPSNSAPMIEGQGISGSVLVTEATQDITITIKDKDGNVIKTINKTAASGGLVDFEWDGKDDAGNVLAPDFYKISASATIGGQKTELQTAGTFKVTSVGLNRATGEIILNVDGYGGTTLDKVIKVI